MRSLQFIFAFIFCVSGSLAIPVATSHQSMVSGDGYRYSYGIVHGPPGIGHAVGESYPHGYGGFGTYAPSYGYEGYGVSHGLGHVNPALAPHPPVAAVPVVHEPVAPLPPIPVELHKPLEHVPVVTKPVSIPFPEYVLSSPEHHYGYGVPHYGEPHHGITHLDHSSYDDHYSSLFDGYDNHHLAYSSPVYGHGGYSAPIYGHGGYGHEGYTYYKPSYHSYY